MGLISLLEITAATDAIGTETTLRFCTGKGYNHPSAPGFYRPRIKQAANIKRSMFDDLRSFGASKVAYGESVIKNNDGAFDYVKDYGFGRNLTHLIGEEGAAYNTFQKVTDGVVEQPSFNLAEFVFRYRDRMQELELPASPARFLGTNSGSTGTEGTADTIGGQNKPRCFGVTPNITPSLLNTALLIYGTNFDASGNPAAVYSFPAVYDGGIVITYSGTDHANLAALQGATIASGQYDTCKALGMFRLGSQAIKAVTCDVIEGATAADRYPGNIINRLLLDSGIASGDISAADITALNSAAPYESGIFITTETYRQALDKIAPSARCGYGPNNEGIYRIKQLNVPAGSPVVTLKRFTRTVTATSADADILSFNRVVSSDAGRGVPAFRVTVKYGKNWTVQSAGELNAGVAEDRRVWLGNDFRTVTTTDATVKTKYPLAPELTFETLLTTEADAQALCDDLLALYSQLWDIYDVKIRLGVALAAVIDLTAIVKLQFNRFGLDGGKLFTILGLEYDAMLQTISLRLWGVA